MTWKYAVHSLRCISLQKAKGLPRWVNDLLFLSFCDDDGRAVFVNNDRTIQHFTDFTDYKELWNNLSNLAKQIKWEGDVIWYIQTGHPSGVLGSSIFFKANLLSLCLVATLYINSIFAQSPAQSPPSTQHRNISLILRYSQCRFRSATHSPG